MKVRIKTLKELFDDGWKIGEDGNSLSKDDNKLSIFAHMLYFAGEILEVEFDSRKFDGTVLAFYWWNKDSYVVV